MTPKEKAKELVDKYVVYAKRPTIKGYTKEVWIYKVIENAKQCALICVDEMIKDASHDPYNAKTRIEYWNSIKKEIELC